MGKRFALHAFRGDGDGFDERELLVDFDSIIDFKMYVNSPETYEYVSFIDGTENNDGDRYSDKVWDYDYFDVTRMSDLRVVCSSEDLGDSYITKANLVELVEGRLRGL